MFMRALPLLLLCPLAACDPEPTIQEHEVVIEMWPESSACWKSDVRVRSLHLRVANATRDPYTLTEVKQLEECLPVDIPFDRPGVLSVFRQRGYILKTAPSRFFRIFILPYTVTHCPAPEAYANTRCLDSETIDLDALPAKVPMRVRCGGTATICNDF